MKINTEALGKIKQQIEMLKGNNVELKINRGRKKIDTIKGVIDNTYPSVFTITTQDCIQKVQTFSYFDVLCGNVVFKNPPAWWQGDFLLDILYIKKIL